MCGILGFIGNRFRNSAAVSLAAIRNRGPDARVVLELGEAVFGHARLSVIDIDGGGQPMQSVDGRYTLAYNGEIYNFRELRADLESRGAAFTTNSDTEVLLHGLIAHGESILPRLDGMFAFAFWDAHARTLLLARDNIGIKPLMYSTAGGGVMFASTVSAFLAVPDFPRALSPQAVRDYFAYSSPMSPRTILREVKQLPPASILRYDAHKNEIAINRYWKIPRVTENPAAAKMNFKDATAQVETALRESVRRQMIADVPLGAFLSGGIDSSLMVRYMSEFSNKRVNTFSMKFNRGGFDESKYALQVAERFNTDHHVFEADTVTGNEFATAIADLDQPLADPAYIMTHILSRNTRKHVTVAISGDGGDEVFGGYEQYIGGNWLRAEKWWQPTLRALLKRRLAPAALQRHALTGRDFHFYQNAHFGNWRNRKSFARWFAPDFAARMQPENTMQTWRAMHDQLGGGLDGGTLTRLDIGTLLPEVFLVKTDRASMAHGLEVRVPFLGAEVLQTALALPPQLHFQHGLKSLLKNIARRELPREVWDRPKQGFAVPLGDYFTREWRAIGDEVINDAHTIAPFLNARAIKRRWQRTTKNPIRKPGGGMTVYRFIVLLLWMRENGL